MKLTGKCALLLLLVLFVVSTKFYPFFPNLINTHDEWVLHSHKLSNRNEFELEVNKTLINVSLDCGLVSSFCVCVLRCTYQWHTHTRHVQMNCLNQLDSPHLLAAGHFDVPCELNMKMFCVPACTTFHCTSLFMWLKIRTNTSSFRRLHCSKYTLTNFYFDILWLVLINRANGSH